MTNSPISIPASGRQLTAIVPSGTYRVGDEHKSLEEKIREARSQVPAGEYHLD